MKTTRDLEDRLKNLPSYTMTQDQKENTLGKLRTRQTKSSSRFFVPIMSLLSILAFVSILLVTDKVELNLASTWKQLFTPEVELTAPQAEVFKSGPYEILGLKDQVGILVMNNQFVAEDTGRSSKLMLYFWGDSEKLVGKNYSVEGMNRNGETITLSSGSLTGPLNDEDAHQLTSFPAFPEQGEWQLSFFVDGKLHSEFVTEVLPPFPATAHYTVSGSPAELTIGEVNELWIKGTGEPKEEIIIQLLDQHGKMLSEERFTNEGGGQHYFGTILFPDKKTYRLIIDGEKTSLFKR